MAPQRSSPTVPQVVWCDDGLVMGEIGTISVAIWRGGVTRERFEAQRLGLGRLVAAHPAGIGFLCIVEPTAIPPDDDMRRASADMVAIHRPHLRYVACVIEGDSIRSAIIRNILTLMRNLVTGKLAYGFVASVPEAVKQLGEHLALGDPTDLVAAVEVLRSHLDDACRASGQRGRTPRA
jgi:hypothetical protein